MSAVDEYLVTVTSTQRAEFARIREIIHQVVPTVEEGVSYGMPAFLYKGKPFLSFHAGKQFLSLYPFSGKVIEKLHNKLTGFELTSGSIHFSEEHLLPKLLLEEIITMRLQEIENK